MNNFYSNKNQDTNKPIFYSNKKSDDNEILMRLLSSFNKDKYTEIKNNFIIRLNEIPGFNCTEEEYNNLCKRIDNLDNSYFVYTNYIIFNKLNDLDKEVKNIDNIIT